MKKKLILVVTALTLCAAIAVGGTLAYLSAQSNELTNTFVYDADPNDPNNPTKIGVELSETEWTKDPLYQWGKTNEGTAPTEGFGVDKPMIPSANLNKNPQLRLTTKVNSFVGVGVKIEGLSWAQFDEIAIFKATKGTAVDKTSKSTFGSGWTYHKTVDDTRYFVYNTKLIQDHPTNSTNTTPALFQQVKIKNAVEQEKLDALKTASTLADDKLFNLVITGYGAQAEAEDSGTDLGTAQSALSQNFDFFKDASLGNDAYPYVAYVKYTP